MGRWVTPAGAGVVVVLAVTLSGSVNAATEGRTADGLDVADATAMITPASGARKVRPDKGVTVRAASGVLDRVSVQGNGRAVDGTLSADRKAWRSTWGLRPGTAYTVTAVARNAGGRATTVTSRFTTMKARSTVRVGDVTPMSGETVGVGMPIMVNFDRPVTDRAAVERALEVRSTRPVEGAWRWIGDQEAVFRTRQYWPAHTTVKLVAHLSGVRAGSGVYGVKDFTRSFKIGSSHIAKISLKKHKSKVYIDGKLARTIPVSGGMGGADSHGNDFRTTSGVHLAMGKMQQVWMTSPNIKPGEPGYYHELVLKDVQISNSGEYVHQSPGEYGCLGHSNCSHGCVRQTVAGAKWFYSVSRRGDVVDITGTSRDLEWNNGWGFWQMSWKHWVKGSAVDRPVTTTPLAPTAAAPASNPKSQPVPRAY
jgi:lipoprotein-anchoring transpeptidase ErfK/SrfK